MPAGQEVQPAVERRFRLGGNRRGRAGEHLGRSHPARAREIARLAGLHLRDLHTELLLAGMFTVISGQTPTPDQPT